MTDIKGADFRSVNALVRNTQGALELTGCRGQRFIAAGSAGREIFIHGTPGNALGAYLNGSEINVFGNAQDAVGDTMNSGKIVVHGNIGDAAGYAMRGGAIYVKGNAGYRAGIHMKEYGEKKPVIVIGGRAGSFLGEYQAGGTIAVLGIGCGGQPTVGDYPCTGMHGGKMLIRGDMREAGFPESVSCRLIGGDELGESADHIREFCSLFGADFGEITASVFTLVTPDSRNPYKRMYVAN